MVKRIVGLDLGRDTIRAVELQGAEKARPMVTRVGTIPVPEVALRSGEVREVSTVATAIKNLWATGGFKTKDVVIGVGNQRVLARDLSVPKMSLAQIREALPFQVQEMLPVPVNDAILDFYPISESEGEGGPVVNGLLIAAIKETVMANVNAVRQAGLNPVHVDLIPFALTRSLARGPAAQTTVVLVDIGASTTNVVVSSNGVPQFIRMIPVGGHDLTKALSTRLEISEQQAEIAKRTRGLSSAPTSSEGEQIAAEVIAATSAELLTALRNTINYYLNVRPQTQLTGVILTGGGGELPGLARALSDTVRLPVVAAEAFGSFDVPKGTLKPESDPQTLTVALGLALGSVV